MRNIETFLKLIRNNTTKIYNQLNSSEKVHNLLQPTIQKKQNFWLPAFAAHVVSDTRVLLPKAPLRGANLTNSVFQSFRPLERGGVGNFHHSFSRRNLHSVAPAPQENKVGNNVTLKLVLNNFKHNYWNPNVRASFIGGMTAFVGVTLFTYLYNKAQDYWHEIQDEEKKEKLANVIKNFERLKETPEELISIFGRSFANIIQAYFSAEKAYREKKYEEALSIIEKAITNDKKKAVVFFFASLLKAQILEKQKKYEEAVNCLYILNETQYENEIRGAVSDELTASYIYMFAINLLYLSKLRLLKELQRIDDIEQTCDEFEKLRKSEDGTFYVLDSLGVMYEQHDRIVRKFMAAEISYLGFYRGFVCQQRGKEDDALLEYHQSIKDFPNIESCFAIVEMMIKKGILKDALNALNSIITTIENVEKKTLEKPIGEKEWDQVLSAAYIKKGTILASLGLFKDAVSAFESSIKYLRNKESYCELGQIHLFFKDYPTAEYFFNEALKIDAKYIDALHGKITALEKQGKEDEANKEKRKDPFLLALEKAREFERELLIKLESIELGGLMLPSHVGVTTDYEYALMCKQAYEEKEKKYLVLSKKEDGKYF
jgi:tetratricopeptide (TPR) repeat protein